jgi:hypothetical protein
MVRISSSYTAADHCPFLNRRDARCGENLSLDRLGYAFGRCFGQYHLCPVYAEMLLERQSRQSESRSDLVAGHVHQSTHAKSSELVQVTVDRKVIARIGGGGTTPQTTANRAAASTFPHANAA